jgi:hypothetical protein
VSATANDMNPATMSPQQVSGRQPRIGSIPAVRDNNSTSPIGYASPTSTVAGSPCIAASIGPFATAAATAPSVRPQINASMRNAAGTRFNRSRMSSTMPA